MFSKLMLIRFKKAFLVSLILLAVCSSSLFSYTATNSAVIYLTIVNESVLSVTNPYPDGEILYGSLAANTTNHLPGTGQTKAVFRNNGTLPTDLSLRAEVIEGGVALITGGLGSPVPANNQIRVLGIFGQWDGVYDSNADFQSDDVLTTAYVTADADTYAKTSDDISLKGYNLNTGDERVVLFCIEPGTVTSPPLDVRIKIWAKANPD